jgi:hypothetical protein
MTLQELIDQFRIEAKDQVAPYFWSSEYVTGWLNEAEHEACIRARLIREIQNPDVCIIAVLPDQSVYPLHPSLYEIEYLMFDPGAGSIPLTLDLASPESMTERDRHWRMRTGTPRYAIQSDTHLRLTPTPKTSGTLMLECLRLPINKMLEDTDKPEIHSAHHRHLIQWALFKAFGVPDSEAFDEQRQAQAYAAFENYFGERPRADLRRSTRIDRAQVVKAFMP